MQEMLNAMPTIANKTKILHILWTGRSGGMEKFVRDIALYSDKKQFKQYICFLAQKNRFGEEMHKNGCDVQCLNMKTGLSLFAALSLRKVIKDINPDIIHNHQRNILANMIIMLFRRVKKIYFEHGGHLMSGGSFATSLFYLLFAARYQIVMTNSNYVCDKMKTFKTLVNKEILVFYIGVHVEMYRQERNKSGIKKEIGLMPGHKIVGIVGRLVEQKGIDDFIKVAAKIQKVNKLCQFVVVGDGPLQKPLEQLALQLHVKIKFLGDRSDVPQLMSAFDLFMITSKWEPFGIVVLEALASRVPVVGFSVEGMKEIFEAGGGILVEKRNMQELADTVLEVLNDENKREQLIEEGYKIVTNKFNFKNRIKYLEEIYKKIKVSNENFTR